MTTPSPQPEPSALEDRIRALEAKSLLEDRLRALEGKALILETWLKVVVGIAALLGISGTYLTSKYVNLATTATTVAAKVDSLDRGLEAKALTILQAKAPAVLKDEMPKSISITPGHGGATEGEHPFTCPSGEVVVGYRNNFSLLTSQQPEKGTSNIDCAKLSLQK